LNALSDWLRALGRPLKQERTGFLLLSHHAGDQFWVDEGKNTLSPTALRGEFAPGSVAVLDGCETGKPTSSAFVQRLNDHGFSAIIATATAAVAKIPWRQPRPRQA
jgi:hypothetical protein